MGFINDGKIILVEEKKKLLAKLGNKKLVFKMSKKLNSVPRFLSKFNTRLNKMGRELEVDFGKSQNQVLEIISLIKKSKLDFIEFDIKKRSLENIFIDFIKGNQN